MDNEIEESKLGDGSEFLLYQAATGETRIQVRVVDETVWLSQRLMAELFEKTVPTIGEHIQNIFEEGELDKDSVIRNFLITAPDGKNYNVTHYNLDVIISVGYRVRSQRGTQFRKWATAQLKEFIIKGFVLDDDRLKQVRTERVDHFDELLRRIRAIRTSERRFYQKITDIFALSADYDRDSAICAEFFKTVQNKLHWAIHGHTAAEVIVERADSSKANMGMVTWDSKSLHPQKKDAIVAKNYLSEEELESLNLLVEQFLTFAEFQANQRKQMTMAQWKLRLDKFLELNECDILTSAGKIRSDFAKDMAEKEYAKYKADQRKIEATEPTSDFDKVVEKARRLEQS